jgi:hypothetical protein
MNGRPIYAPVVKAKLNDLKALGALPLSDKAKIRPLIDVMPPTKKQCVEDRLAQAAHYVAKYVPLGDLTVDFYGVAGLLTADGRDASIAGLEELIARGRRVIPAYGFQRNDEAWGPLRKVIRKLSSGFCFRIDVDDLDDQSEDTWAQIIERGNELSLSMGDTDLFIDLRSISVDEVPALKEEVLDFLHMGPSVPSYRSVTIAGSSALKTVTDVPEDGDTDVSRQELELWGDLARDLPDSITLTYGDYGVVHPEFSDRGSAKNINGKIRYTRGGRIRYFRGHRLHGDFAQYHVLANRVRDSGLFLGRSFSYGDRYLDDVADFRAKSGSPGTWVLADMNHHLQYTCAQMTGLAASIRDAASRTSALRLIERAV